MKKNPKLIAMTLVGCLMINITSFAATTPASVREQTLITSCLTATVYNQQYEQDLRALMSLYNFSEEDQVMLLKFEQNRMAANSYSLYGFPSNPQVGDEYAVTKRVGVNAIIAGGSGAAQIAASLAGILNLPVVLVIGLAAGIAADYASDHNFKGVEIEINYVYGPTNDGPLGWNYGPIYYETY